MLFDFHKLTLPILLHHQCILVLPVTTLVAKLAFPALRIIVQRFLSTPFLLDTRNWADGQVVQRILWALKAI